jgi:hypothetical protein
MTHDRLLHLNRCPILHCRRYHTDSDCPRGSSTFAIALLPPLNGYYKSYDNVKGRYTDGYLYGGDKYSVVSYTEFWNNHNIYYEKVVRNGDPNDFFYFNRPGQTSGYSDDSLWFHPGTISLTPIELQRWDSLSSAKKQEILNTLNLMIGILLFNHLLFQEF